MTVKVNSSKDLMLEEGTGFIDRIGDSGEAIAAVVKDVKTIAGNV